MFLEYENSGEVGGPTPQQGTGGGGGHTPPLLVQGLSFRGEGGVPALRGKKAAAQNI